MAKQPRKRKATTPKKATGKRSAKRATSKRRAVTPLPDDEDIFIPKTARHPVAVAVADDDEEIFIPKRGRPIEVQSDLVEEVSKINRQSRAPLGISNDEFWKSLEPSAGNPGGWTQAELAEHGLTLHWRGHVICRYGGRCDGSTSNVPGVSSHHYGCPYWLNEGKDRTPFD